MITRSQIRDAVVSAVTGLHPNLSVFVGTVPDRLPTYSDGTIKPYVAVWAGHGSGLWDMEARAGLADTDAVHISIQTQVVGAREADVFDAADLVRVALTNLMIGGHALKPDYPSQSMVTTLIDTAVTPHRHYLPLIWNLTTQ